eukprot:EG_transcript_9991
MAAAPYHTLTLAAPAAAAPAGSRWPTMALALAGGVLLGLAPRLAAPAPATQLVTLSRPAALSHSVASVPVAPPPRSARPAAVAPYVLDAEPEMAPAGPSRWAGTPTLGAACAFIAGAALLTVARQWGRRAPTAAWATCAAAGLDDRVVVVRNLPPSATWQTLKDHFAQAGEVLYSNVFYRGPTPERGVVRFARPEEAERALMIMGKYAMDGYALEVTADAPAPGGERYGRPAPTSRSGVSRAAFTEDRIPLGAAGEWRRASEDQAPLEEDFVAEVDQLVAQRAEYRANRDFRLADEIRQDLAGRGVFLNDRERTWSASAPDQGGRFRQRTEAESYYVREANDTNADGSAADLERVAEVERLLSERQQYRNASNFEDADLIREKLRAMGVFIDDRSRTWTTVARAPRSSAGFEEEPNAFRVLNLPPGASWPTLKDHFKQAGDVEYVNINNDPITGAQSTRGVVRFSSEAAAENALELAGTHPYMGAILELRPLRAKTPNRFRQG